jgi:hypothetical protein
MHDPYCMENISWCAKICACPGVTHDYEYTWTWMAPQCRGWETDMHRPWYETEHVSLKPACACHTCSSMDTMGLWRKPKQGAKEKPFRTLIFRIGWLWTKNSVVGFLTSTMVDRLRAATKSPPRMLAIITGCNECSVKQAEKQYMKTMRTKADCIAGLCAFLGLCIDVWKDATSKAQDPSS